jgi:FAD/FMN-containing dehydrogenase
MDILIAIDDLDDLVLRSPAIPLSGLVAIDEQVLREAVGRVRAHTMELLGRFPPLTGPIADVFRAIDELEALVAAAGRVPLINRLRVPRERVYDLLDRLRATLPAAILEVRGTEPSEELPSNRALAAIDTFEHDLQRLSWRAVFSDSLRVDEKLLQAATWHLRAALREPAAPAEVQAAVAELEDLVRAAKPVPLTSQVRVPRKPLHELLDRMRAALAQTVPDR